MDTISRELADPAPPPDDVAMQALLRNRVQTALRALPPMYRTVLLLRDLQELSTHETASVLGISDDNVKTRLRRARMLLSQKLKV
jgi:RNA polymerase sigma-70 factor (ECF subfamily)